MENQSLMPMDSLCVPIELNKHAIKTEMLGLQKRSISLELINSGVLVRVGGAGKNQKSNKRGKGRLSGT